MFVSRNLFHIRDLLVRTVEGEYMTWNAIGILFCCFFSERNASVISKWNMRYSKFSSLGLNRGGRNGRGEGSGEKEQLAWCSSYFQSGCYPWISSCMLILRPHFALQHLAYQNVLKPLRSSYRLNNYNSCECLVRLAKPLMKSFDWKFSLYAKWAIIASSHKYLSRFCMCLMQGISNIKIPFTPLSYNYRRKCAYSCSAGFVWRFSRYGCSAFIEGIIFLVFYLGKIYLHGGTPLRGYLMLSKHSTTPQTFSSLRRRQSFFSSTFVSSYERVGLRNFWLNFLIAVVFIDRCQVIRYAARV